MKLFKILFDLAQMSFLRAYDYSLAMYEKQYFPNTRIMNAKYFEERVENHMALNAKKVSSFVLLELETGDYTLEEINSMIADKVRTTDIIGVTSDGKLQIILPQASHDDLKHILPRFEGLEIQIKVL
jgi:GGDEF domain-containing protein